CFSNRLELKFAQQGTRIEPAILHILSQHCLLSRLLERGNLFSLLTTGSQLVGRRIRACAQLKGYHPNSRPLPPHIHRVAQSAGLTLVSLVQHSKILVRHPERPRFFHLPPKKGLGQQVRFEDTWFSKAAR